MSSNALSDLLRAIEEVAMCPVCLERVQPPVSQCCNGHGVCGQCRTGLTQCPICRGPFLAMQQRLLEQVLQILPKFCKYSNNGCLALTILDNHHEFCAFRPIRCRIGENNSCNWCGSVKDWSVHVRSSHKVFLTAYPGNTVRKLHFRKFNNWVTFTYCHLVDDNLFELSVSKSDGKFHQVVRHIPLQQPRNVYYFRISFMENNIVSYRHTIKATNLEENYTPEKSFYCMSVPIKDLQCSINQGSLEATFEVIPKNIQS